MLMVWNIVTKSVSDLRLALNTFENYFYESSLEVNVNKTEVTFINESSDII